MNSSLAKGFGWKLLERFSVQGIQFTLQIVLARLLDPEHYGSLALMMIFVTLANVVIQNGFNTSLIQNKDVDDDDFSSVFWLILGISLLVYMSLYAFAPLLADYYGMPYLENPFKVICLMLIPGALNSVQLAIIRRSLDFKKEFTSNLISIVLAGIISIVCAYHGFGLWSLVVQTLLNTSIACITMWYVLGWRPRFVFNLSRVKVLFSYGYKLVLAGLLDTFSQDLSAFVIGAKYSTSSLGFFTRGKQFPSAIMGAINGEIITTPFTFASTTHAIVRNGCEPVFCDIDPTTYCIDASKIEDLITDRTVAIAPVHVYGHACDVEEIQRIANKYGLKVIYDAAHAFGVKYKGSGLGSYGDVSCYSFHATKVFNSIEGGCVCYHDEDFGKTLYQLKNFGIHGPEVVDGVGANAKMNEFCAAMGLCNLRHVDGEIAKRKAVVERYREHLEGVEGLQLSPIQKDMQPNYAYFPVVFDEKVFGSSRNEVFDALAKIGVGARKYFYPLTSSFDCFHGKYDVMKTPIAVRISKRVLTLPLYADLALEDVDRICKVILECKK